MKNEKSMLTQQGNSIKDRRGIYIFSIVYLFVALLMTFLIYKSGQSRFSASYTDIVFDSYGGNLVSETMSFPAGNYAATIYGTILSDSDIVVYSGNEEMYRAAVEGNESYRDITFTYTLPKRTSDFRIAFLGAGDDVSGVSSVYFQSDSPINNDSPVKAALSFFILAVVYVFILMFALNKVGKYQLISFLLLLIIAIFASSPLMTDHLIYGHDLRCHTGRIDGIRNAFMDGQTIPLIVPDAFNGYGVLTFEYPWLFLLIPVFLRLCDVSMVLSYEIFLFIINTATAFVCFFSIRSVLKTIKELPQKEGEALEKSHRATFISLICSVFYTLSTYRLSDVYIRAAMGEMLAMIFLPLLTAGIYHICTGEKSKWWMLLIALCGILQSHILSCVLIIPLVILLVLPFIKQIINEKRWIQFLYAGALFILLNLWYIIPFVRFFMLPLNTGEFTQYLVTNNIVLFKNLFLTSVHTGFADEDRFTPSLGSCALICILIIIAALIADLRNKEKSAKTEEYFNLFKFSASCTAGIFIFIIISSELIPWDFIENHFARLWKCIHMVQFPYRFLTMAMVCIIYALAVSLFKLSVNEQFKRAIVPIAALILTFSLIDSGNLMDNYMSCGWVTFKSYSGGFVSYTPKDYLPGGVNTDNFSDLSPLISEGEITDYVKNGTNITFTYSSDENTVATVPLNYYPCYKAVTETGEKIPLSAWEDKRILMTLPAGTHTVKISTILSRGGSR